MQVKISLNRALYSGWWSSSARQMVSVVVVAWLLRRCAGAEGVWTALWLRLSAPCWQRRSSSSYFTCSALYCASTSLRSEIRAASPLELGGCTCARVRAGYLRLEPHGRSSRCCSAASPVEAPPPAPLPPRALPPLFPPRRRKRCRAAARLSVLRRRLGAPQLP